MEILNVRSERSPLITFDDDTLTIEGRSFMDNSVEFYRNLIAKVDGLPSDNLKVAVKLDYFNTSSSKCILEFFRALERMGSVDGKNVQILWYFESGNSDLEEAGEDYRDLIEAIPFDLIEV